MTEQKRIEIAAVWSDRINAADEYYKDWSRRFKVAELEEAYYGFQWDEYHGDPDEYMPYVMNMIFASIDVKVPSLLFTNPVYSVKAKPSKYDFDPTTASMRANLKQDALNYFVQGGIKYFSSEIEMCILDAFFRFGIFEVGYSADFIQNPDAGKPYLVSETTELTDEDGKVIRQPEQLIEYERIFGRRIPADRFRVGGIDQTQLERCSWYGYLDFIRKEDLLASANINDGYNKEVIVDADGCTPDSPGWSDSTFDFKGKGDWEKMHDKDVLAVWKVYDSRSKTMMMFNYSVSDIIYTEEYTRPKHFALKFRNKLTGWYPLPVTFNWISPQSEVNETRESARIHRRRFMRKYIARRDAFKSEELDKLINGGDGTIAVSEIDPSQSIGPMPNMNLGAQHEQQMSIVKDDFNVISGTSAEQRGQSDRTTATQSNIKERRSVIRESRDKEIVANWLKEIGKEILLTVKENMTMAFWIKVSQDMPGLFEESNFVQEQYSLITGDDLGDEDFEVDIKISSMSPVDQEQEVKSVSEFLALITQYPQVAMSPTMIQEIADRVGFRNEKAIAEFVRAAQLMQTLQVLQLAQQTGQDPLQLMMTTTFMRNVGKAGEGNPAAQRSVAQITPPTNEQVNNQIANQLTTGEQQ